MTITADRVLVGLGETVNLTVTISQTNGPSAGFYLLGNGVGKFGIVDPSTRLLGAGVTHSMPRTGAGGNTTFRVGWTAPLTPGGADFYVWANSANGDGTPGGDGEGTGFFSTAFGCAGIKYYRDYDGDGVGSANAGYGMNCSLLPLYSASAGDCNDNDPKVSPNEVEVCDGRDNNCDDRIDEDLPLQDYCVDEDGDGHGVNGRPRVTGCGPPKGYGTCDDDCNDRDAAIYPSAAELCNSRDDNCNGRIDENARTTCGVGWCARFAEGCSSQCTPGQPRPEQCNAFDDDCDGVVDNGESTQLCGQLGLVCRSGECVTDSGTGGAMSAGMSPPASGSATPSPSNSSSPNNPGPTSNGSGGLYDSSSREPSRGAQPEAACAVRDTRTPRAFALAWGLMALAIARAARRAWGKSKSFWRLRFCRWVERRAGALIRDRGG